MSSSSKIVLRRTQESSIEAAKELLRNFALFIGLTNGKKSAPEPELFQIWGSALADLSPAQIRSAGERLLKIWRYPNLPLPGDVRAQIDSSEEKNLDFEAERQWQALLEWIHQNYFPDVGVRRGAKPLAAVIQHAARAAGGIHFIEGCSESQLVWCRKNFLVAYKNVHETGQVEYLIREDQAKQILATLRAAIRQKKESMARAVAPKISEFAAGNKNPRPNHSPPLPKKNKCQGQTGQMRTFPPTGNGKSALYTSTLVR